jgi:hypothetical protein
MKIYQALDYEYLPEITGIKDGTAALWVDEKIAKKDITFYKLFWNLEMGQTHLLPSNKDFVCHFAMKKKAKFTDFIHTAVFQGFVVNGKVKDLLSNFHLPNHHYYKVIFHEEKTQREIDEGYWWLCYELINGDNGVIDFPKSEFWEKIPPLSLWRKNMKTRPQDIPNVVIKNSYQAHVEAFEKDRMSYMAKKLYFTEKFDSDLDLWGTYLLTAENYISENLLQAFKDNQITGFAIEKPRCEFVF